MPRHYEYMQGDLARHGCCLRITGALRYVVLLYFDTSVCIVIAIQVLDGNMSADVSEEATAFCDAQADLVRVSTSLKLCITNVYVAVYTMHTTCVHKLYVCLNV
jgi:hypothetical protein